MEYAQSTITIRSHAEFCSYLLLHGQKASQHIHSSVQWLYIRSIHDSNPCTSCHNVVYCMLEGNWMNATIRFVQKLLFLLCFFLFFVIIPFNGIYGLKFVATIFKSDLWLSRQSTRFPTNWSRVRFAETSCNALHNSFLFAPPKIRTYFQAWTSKIKKGGHFFHFAHFSYIWLLGLTFKRSSIGVFAPERHFQINVSQKLTSLGLIALFFEEKRCSFKHQNNFNCRQLSLIVRPSVLSAVISLIRFNSSDWLGCRHPKPDGRYPQPSFQ